MSLGAKMHVFYHFYQNRAPLWAPVILTRFDKNQKCFLLPSQRYNESTLNPTFSNVFWIRFFTNLFTR